MEKKKDLPIRDAAAPEPKRRRVRKGTRSCWECRRRKIRCIFPSEDSSTCANCETRGTSCVSQEFADEPASAPNQRVTQRLGRVEEMLEQLIEKIMPDSYTPGSRGRSTDSSPASADATELEPVDSGCPYSGGNPPICDVLTPLRDTNNGTSCSGNLPTPESSQYGGSALGKKYTDLSKTLHDLLPCQQDLQAIVEASPGVNFVISFFSRYRDVVAGQTEKPSILCKNPPSSSHPVVLAKRLMQIATCLQQIQPATPIKLVAAEPIQSLSRRYVSAVSSLVAYNDELVGYAEGLETLALLALYHANIGNLRKSWLMLRRTLSIAQLMGVDRWGDRPLRSADPTSNPATRIKARAFWFRLNFTDRYLSLVLGLPAGTDDNSFLADDPDDEPTDRLEKQHTVVMGAIIKRNTSSNKGDTCFTTTQEIDCNLEAAVRSVAPDFWQFPSGSTLEHPDLAVRLSATTRLMLHMNHHNLLILLHLPYMLRDPKERRWDYSKETCIGSSRKLLKTFLVFRNMNKASHACRHTDYGALTASMTLLLGYLDPKMQARDQHTTSRREADRKLIQDARNSLLRMADLNDDKLARDAASIIARLLPLLNPDLMTSGSQNQGGSHDSVGEAAAIHLDIPYLGIININPAAHANSGQHDIQPHIYATSTNSLNTDTPDTPASTTTASTKTHQQDYVKFPAHTSLSHVSQPSSAEWSVPANQQHFTLPGGDQEEVSHMLSFSRDYNNTPNEYDYNGLTAPMMQFEWSQAQLAHPELTAEADEWTFQGFDTTYFESLFSSNAQGLWDISKT
ncbi:hypothetical protein F5B22DRAFT_228746 [Xylaria bambusicola]|uniref:uncharacterized protein n=1 Tax=Xylaria bambusicola TaxID=326684 RepID=UPI002007CE05|nr:uncharacterized protein F5B22DRAFT_228746 [Xylaria bambusicola]KAI0514465.1 hypothetical protein F5B22DRAFT_228746 [Xylaria bambusicola]